MHQAIKRGSRVTAKLKRPKMRDANLRKIPSPGAEHLPASRSRWLWVACSEWLHRDRPHTKARPRRASRLAKPRNTALPKPRLRRAAPTSKRQTRAGCRPNITTRERCNGQAQAQWAEGTTITRSNVNAELARSKTVEPIVACSAWLAMPPTDNQDDNATPRQQNHKGINSLRPPRARAEETARTQIRRLRFAHRQRQGQR